MGLASHHAVCADAPFGQHGLQGGFFKAQAVARGEHVERQIPGVVPGVEVFAVGVAQAGDDIQGPLPPFAARAANGAAVRQLLGGVHAQALVGVGGGQGLHAHVVVHKELDAVGQVVFVLGVFGGELP